MPILPLKLGLRLLSSAMSLWLAYADPIVWENENTNWEDSQ